MRHYGRIIALVCAIFCPLWLRALPAPLATDTIQGRVVDSTSTPIVDVLVTVTASPSNIRQAIRTNELGQFHLIFADTNVSYTIVVRRLGYTTAPARTVASNQAHLIVVPDISLRPLAQELKGVNVVRHRPSVHGRENETIQEGSSFLRNRTPDVAAEGLNDWLSDLSMLTRIPSVDGSPQFSAGGAAPDQNNLMIGGNSFLGSTIPTLLTLRGSLAIAQYDVSQGQFSGAQLQFSRFSWGSEAQQPQRRVGLTVTTPWLQLTDPAAIGAGAPFSYYRASILTTHPIIYGKLSSIFAADISRQAMGAESLFGASATSLLQLGLPPDSVRRLNQVTQQFGIPTRASAPSQQVRNSGTMYWELGYAPSLDFSAGVRLTGEFHTTANLGATPFASQAFLSHESGGNIGLQGSIAWTPLSGFSNSVQTYYAVRTMNTRPYLSLPTAAVQILSPVGGDSTAVPSLFQSAAVSLGGNPLSSAHVRRTVWETIHNTSWMSWGGKHRWKVATLLRFDGLRNESVSNMLGTFGYQSIEDFAAGRATSFTRTLFPGRQLSASAWSGALSFGDSWRPTGSLQVMYGVRGETSYLPIGSYDTSVTSHIVTPPSQLVEFRLSPRVGFAWTPATGRYGLFQLGTGEFRGPMSVDLVTSARLYRGLPDTFLGLQCLGSAVPIPDWQAYQSDQQTIPTTCLDSTSSAAPTLTSQLPTVFTFAPHFKAPRVWRSSASWTKGWSRNRDETARAKPNNTPMSGSTSITLLHSLGETQPGTIDRNLVSTPAFTLDAEGSRQMFVAPNAIDPASGLATLTSSRLDPSLGQVLEQQSTLHYTSTQVTTSLGGSIAHKSWGLNVGLSYTWSRTRDEEYSGDSTGNPFKTGWSRSPFERRHHLAASVSTTMERALRTSIGFTGTLVSGAPFTPMVGSDLNGDGQYDDRVFLPATTDATPLAQALNSFITTAPQRVRDCLTPQRGRLVARNSCTGPWSGEINMYASLSGGLSHHWFNTLLRQRTVSIAAQNLLAGLDRLLHPNSPKGWGMVTLVDPTLLRTQAFDPTNRQFHYELNPNFGTTQAAKVLFRSPFVVRVGLSMPWGNYRFYGTHHLVKVSQNADLDRARSDVKRALEIAVIDPFVVLTRMADSLLLTTDQMHQIDQWQATLGVQREQVLTHGTEQILAITRADSRPSGPALDSLIERQRFAILKTLSEVQKRWAPGLAKMLAPEQLAMLPSQLQVAITRQGASWGM